MCVIRTDPHGVTGCCTLAKNAGQLWQYCVARRPEGHFMSAASAAIRGMSNRFSPMSARSREVIADNSLKVLLYAAFLRLFSAKRALTPARAAKVPCRKCGLVCVIAVMSFLFRFRVRPAAALFGSDQRPRCPDAVCPGTVPSDFIVSGVTLLRRSDFDRARLLR